ncbi:MAG: Transport permease protein [Actinobacteria bacterium]|nr:Transport permease protein [Actinomycetota bacterium]
MKSAPSERSPSPSNRNPGVSSVPTKIIEPSRGWKMLDLGELWRYRELLGVLVRRDLKVRYKQTVIGVAWVILRPLASMAIFTLVFGMLVRVPSDGYPYALFVFSALLPWTYFSGAVLLSGNSLVSSSGLVGKVSFPRLIIPVAAVAGGLVDLCISVAVLLAILPVFGVGWTMNLLAVPILALGIIMAALGVGTLFSALTVAYRDFGHLAGFALQIWMYLTPVVYPESLIPERWRFLLLANPMAALVEGFRAAFLGKPFDFGAIAVSLALSAAVFAAGVAYFGKVERRFADII